MERTSDFSIERILSSELRPRPRPAGPPGRPGPLYAPVPLAVPVPVPVAVPLHSYPVMRFGHNVYAYGDRVRVFYPPPAFYLSCSRPAGAQLPPGPAGPPQPHQQQQQQQQQPQAPAAAPRTQARLRGRVRTTFTEAQSKQLEALLKRTRYPSAGARTELARRTGLSEEIVRVWFKNRRARRKQQQQEDGSGLKPASPQQTPPTAAAPGDRKPFSSFL